jgi:hypothetical protein
MYTLHVIKSTILFYNRQHTTKASNFIDGA